MADQPTAKEPVQQRIQFNYVKSQYFRVVHVDGALGGPTPQGYIHCAVYSERPAIPQVTEHAVTETSSLGPGEIIKGRTGFVREMDVDLIMSRSTAVEIRDWLSARIEELDKLQKGVEDAKG
jgi:hypothetical protein